MLNKALRLLRVFGGLSQTELASRLGVTKSWISEIESGRKVPTLSLLNAYSKELDIPLSSIMFFSEKLQDDGQSEKTRAFVSKKILAILDYIAADSDGGDQGVEGEEDVPA
ncbi:helix-turn-helix transcriptional regulator [Phenylobacterium terrae]|uniref:Helix-turn-helix transcriptional regulator n=1 Tax=Phenylobacterium terrae TaxID=2665495 RepID=A0ABW4MY89_9CAUL